MMKTLPSRLRALLRSAALGTLLATTTFGGGDDDDDIDDVPAADMAAPDLNTAACIPTDEVCDDLGDCCDEDTMCVLIPDEGVERCQPVVAP